MTNVLAVSIQFQFRSSHHSRVADCQSSGHISSSTRATKNRRMASYSSPYYSEGGLQSVTAQTLQPVFVVLSYGLSQAEKGFNALPGSAVLLRFVYFCCQSSFAHPLTISFCVGISARATGTTQDAPYLKFFS